MKSKTKVLNRPVTKSQTPEAGKEPVQSLPYYVYQHRDFLLLYLQGLPVTHWRQLNVLSRTVYPKRLFHLYLLDMLNLSSATCINNAFCQMYALAHRVSLPKTPCPFGCCLFIYSCLSSFSPSVNKVPNVCRALLQLPRIK